MKKQGIYTILAVASFALACYAQVPSNTQRDYIKRIQGALGLPAQLQDGVAGELTLKAALAMRDERDALRREVTKYRQRNDAGLIEGPYPNLIP